MARVWSAKLTAFMGFLYARCMRLDIQQARPEKISVDEDLGSVGEPVLGE